MEELLILFNKKYHFLDYIRLFQDGSGTIQKFVSGDNPYREAFRFYSIEELKAHLKEEKCDTPS